MHHRRQPQQAVRLGDLELDNLCCLPGIGTIQLKIDEPQRAAVRDDAAQTILFLFFLILLLFTVCCVVYALGMPLMGRGV